MNLTWDDRQRAMLAEMGYRLPRVPAVAGPAPVAEPAPEPVPPPATAPVALAPVAAAPRMPAPAGGATPVVAGAGAGLSTFTGLALPALREAVAACRGCGLCEQRRNAVFGAGALRQVQWLVVTDPVDDVDDAAGEPFTGEAGRLLDRMLRAAGHSRGGEAASVFVTPVVKCRPPRGRPAQPAELAACEAVLAAQVELLRPRLVLALGLQAARHLTGLAEPLGRLRGRVHRWRDLPLVVTYHPAYLLRSPADKAGAWDDLCLARRTVPTP